MGPPGPSWGSAPSLQHLVPDASQWQAPGPGSPQHSRAPATCGVTLGQLLALPARLLCLRRCVGSTCSQGPGGRPALWLQRLPEPCLAGVLLPLPCCLFFPFL